MEQWDILIASRSVAAAIFCASAMIFFFIAKAIYHREISILKATVSSLKDGKNVNRKVANKGMELSKKRMTQKISQIDNLIELGENTLEHKKDYLRTGSLYVFSEMRELRDGTLSLLLELDYQENPIYQEVLNIPLIGPHLSPRELYATKHGFVVSHVEALRVVKKQLERKLKKK